MNKYDKYDRPVLDEAGNGLGVFGTLLAALVIVGGIIFFSTSTNDSSQTQVSSNASPVTSPSTTGTGPTR